MGNRTSMIILSVASDSSSYNADINALTMLMSDGLTFTIYQAAAMAQSVRAFASPHAQSRVHVFESQL